MGRLLLLVTVLLISVAMLLTVRNFDKAGVPQAQDIGGTHPRYIVRDAEWTRLGADGHPQFHVTASTIDYYDDQSAVLGNMTMDGLSGSKGAWTLTSPAGQMPDNQERVLLKKPVVATAHSSRSGEPIQLYTDQMWVDSKRKEIYTDAPIRMIQGQQQATATGLRADWAGQKLDLLHDVKVTYVPHG